jgi:hypothetical protein
MSEFQYFWLYLLKNIGIVLGVIASFFVLGIIATSYPDLFGWIVYISLGLVAIYIIILVSIVNAENRIKKNKTISQQVQAEDNKQNKT